MRNNFGEFANFWAESVSRRHPDTMIPPKSLRMVEDNLKQANMTYSILVKNVETLVDMEKGIENKDLFSRNFIQKHKIFRA